MQCGLLGRQLGHSYSPQIHSLLADYSYTLFEKEPNELKDFLKSNQFTGLNVTIPYKKEVIAYCDELSDCAKKLGAVNTIVRKPNGKLIGHNTDYFGFQSMVLRSGLTLEGKKALVLGSGGASVTAVAVLQELGADVIVISRNGENNYNNLQKHFDAALIVNATPVGMYPNTGHSPISLDGFTNLEGVFDLIYNPARTTLILVAEKRGIPTQNGLWMLVAQAKESAQWFIGKEISDDIISDIHQKLRMQMQNIILIGMPGSGKSTIGQLLATKLEKTFIDADCKIVETAKMSIPDIFASLGEQGFRKIESEVLCELGKASGCVISTGGGCVTQAENYSLLHQNGTILWLQRDIACLPTDGRPLSQNGQLEKMYAIRQPLYSQFADYIIDNNTKADNAVKLILKVLELEV